MEIGCDQSLCQKQRGDKKVSEIVGNVGRGWCCNARDGDGPCVELVEEQVRTRGVVHRWICDDGKLADVFGTRR